jgi:hypothetical protein
MYEETKVIITALETVTWAQNPYHMELMGRAASELRRLSALEYGNEPKEVTQDEPRARS